MAFVPISDPTAATATFPEGVLVARLEAGTDIVRIHDKALGPVWFGPKPGTPPAHRFDAPGGEYKICYAAEKLDGAFVETILHGLKRIIRPAGVDRFAWTILRPTRHLIVAKLFDEGLSRHGADASVSSCNDYSKPRKLALAIYHDAPDVDGVAYRARHNDGEVCYALFDRVGVAELTPAAPTPFETHHDIVTRLARKHGVVFDISATVPPPP